jgi:hypothetical protein
LNGLAGGELCKETPPKRVSITGADRPHIRWRRLRIWPAPNCLDAVGKAQEPRLTATVNLLDRVPFAALGIAPRSFGESTGGLLKEL